MVEIKDSLLIAEMFNNYFADSNPELALKIPPLNNRCLQYVIAALSLSKK